MTDHPVCGLPSIAADAGKLAAANVCDARTSFAGLLYAGYGDGRFFATALAALANPGLLLAGLPFSFTFLSILLAHELGHFFACRYYGIRCTPPFFIPAPISIA